jgi:hypothetical protein
MMQEYRDIQGLLEGIRYLAKIEDCLIRKFSLETIVHSPKLTKLLENPGSYLAMKVGLPMDTSIEELTEKTEHELMSRRVLITTIGANLRSIYQIWVLIGLLMKLGTSLVYPTDSRLLLGVRASSGKKGPVAIIQTRKQNKIAFFLDTVIPSSKSSQAPARRLRPDIVLLVLERVTDNVYDMLSDTCLGAADILAVIECKESKSWPWTKKQIYDPFSNKPRKIDVTHLQMVKYYSMIYNARAFFVISRLDSPKRALDFLSTEKITILDKVGFDVGKLQPAVQRIKEAISNPWQATLSGVLLRLM